MPAGGIFAAVPVVFIVIGVYIFYKTGVLT
jgi:hypothetical protein